MKSGDNRPTALKALLRPFQIARRSAASRATRTSTGPLDASNGSSRRRSASTTSLGPSSSTINTASHPAGYSACTAADAASSASASMISSAPGNSPAPMTAATASPACSSVR